MGAGDPPSHGFRKETTFVSSRTPSEGSTPERNLDPPRTSVSHRPGPRPCREDPENPVRQVQVVGVCCFCRRTGVKFLKIGGPQLPPENSKTCLSGFTLRGRLGKQERLRSFRVQSVGIHCHDRGGSGCVRSSGGGGRDGVGRGGPEFGMGFDGSSAVVPVPPLSLISGTWPVRPGVSH